MIAIFLELLNRHTRLHAIGPFIQVFQIFQIFQISTTDDQCGDEDGRLVVACKYSLVLVGIK